MAEQESFVRPRFGWFALLDGGIFVLAVLALSEEAHRRAKAAAPVPERPQLQALLAGTAMVHVGEALAARRIARRHGLPSGRWARQTFVVGFPSLTALRRLAKTAVTG